MQDDSIVPGREMRMTQTSIAEVSEFRRERRRAHFDIMRLDHSIKQIFVLPGIVVAFSISQAGFSAHLVLRAVAGIMAMTTIASSNYVLNEILDAPFDRLHPAKRFRPAALGLVNPYAGYAQWLILAACGFGMANEISRGLFGSCFLLWMMGVFYNVRPLRLKDIPYLDVIAESINNPIRFCAGWYIITTSIVPPVSLLIAYWMLGAYFMALKRFSEYREIGPVRAGWYRKSFRHYTEKSLLNSVVFYAATSMLFFGAFIMRYRLELVLSFPVIALLMAAYFNLAFEPDSAVQNPEKLFREPRLMFLLAICVVFLAVLLFVRVPHLEQIFPRSVAP